MQPQAPNNGQQHGHEKDLGKKILLRIERRERRIMTTKATAFAMLLAASVFISIYGVFDVVNDASHSGFFAFASLFFSDFSMAMANFSDFALSMVESFPILAMILFLSGVLFACWSLSRLLEEKELMHHHTFSALQ
ncbi:MAG TPA: hypothetical protein VHZ04_00575 [Candidatus Paceibacterota bacterium]|nr:hypothetical protein [Candidatus Paceibacterota bacterium]